MEEDNPPFPLGQAPLLSSHDPGGSMAYTPGMSLVPIGETPTPQELKAQRAQAYRNRYNQKKKAEKQQLEAQLEQGRKELEKLRLEQVSLQDQGSSLSAMGSYAACMLEALTQAKQSASQALSAGMQGLEQVHDWTRHQYVMLPSAVELMTTTLWTPTEAQMRWTLQTTRTEEYVHGHQVFFSSNFGATTRGAAESRCRETSRETGRHVDDPMAEIYYDFNGGKERAYGATSLCKTTAAAVAAACEVEEEEELEIGYGATASGSNSGSIAQHQIAIFGAQPNDLGLNFPRLSLEQIEGLKIEWKKFKKSVQGARKDLNQAVGEATAAFISNIDFEDGSFAPESSAAMAESYLTTVDAATAADAFVKRESRAYMELFIKIIQLLSPMQLAHLKTAPTIQPLVPHLPLVCHLLLDEANAMVSPTNTTPENNVSSGDSDDKNAAMVDVPLIQMINDK
ncbi:hypothetical protein Ndes2526A_g05222 [Nannochloris sp. 'desiccata']